MLLGNSNFKWNFEQMKSRAFDKISIAAKYVHSRLLYR